MFWTGLEGPSAAMTSAPPRGINILSPTLVAMLITPPTVSISPIWLLFAYAYPATALIMEAGRF